jgi:hypothetical protein
MVFPVFNNPLSLPILLLSPPHNITPRRLFILR